MFIIEDIYIYNNLVNKYNGEVFYPNTIRVKPACE